MLISCFCFNFFLWASDLEDRSREFNVQAFCTNFYAVVEKVAPNLEADFRRQIDSGVRSKNLSGLLQQLPFEPDNLGTEDCVFSASCCVLLLHDLCQHMASLNSGDSNSRFDLLAKISVLTFMRHSPAFFDAYFCQALKCYTDVLGVARLPISENDLFTTWSTHYETDWFKGYKRKILNQMAFYVTAMTSIPVAIKESEEKSSKVVSRNQKIIVSYSNSTSRVEALPSQMQLISLVKRITGRLVVMERTFGQLDNGGERGTVRVLQKLRSVSLAGETLDEYRTYPCVYRRVADYCSEITMDLESSSTEAGDNFPALILQIPQVEHDAVSIQFFSLDPSKMLPVKHNVRKTPRLVVNELSASHAMTVSAASALSGKNLWFTGDRGLRPREDWMLTPELQQLLCAKPAVTLK